MRRGKYIPPFWNPYTSKDRRGKTVPSHHDKDNTTDEECLKKQEPSGVGWACASTSKSFRKTLDPDPSLAFWKAYIDANGNAEEASAIRDTGPCYPKVSLGSFVFRRWHHDGESNMNFKPFELE